MSNNSTSIPDTGSTSSPPPQSSPSSPASSPPPNSSGGQSRSSSTPPPNSSGGGGSPTSTPPQDTQPSVVFSTSVVVVSGGRTTVSQVRTTVGGSPTSHPSSGLSSGAQTGVIVGCSVGGGLILLSLLWLLLSRYNRRRRGGFNAKKIVWPEHDPGFSAGAGMGGTEAGLFPESTHRTGRAGLGEEDDEVPPMRESGAFGALGAALQRGFSRRDRGHARQPTLPNVGPVDDLDMDPNAPSAAGGDPSVARSLSGHSQPFSLSDQGHGGSPPNAGFAGRPLSTGYWGPTPPNRSMAGSPPGGVPPSAYQGSSPGTQSIPYNPPSSSDGATHPSSAGSGFPLLPGGQVPLGGSFPQRGLNVPMQPQGEGSTPSSGASDPSPGMLPYPGSGSPGYGSPSGENGEDGQSETGTIDSEEERRRSGGGRLAVVNRSDSVQR